MDNVHTAREDGVQSVMTSPVVTIGPRATIREAAQALRQADVSCLAIVDDGEVTGVVSERDLVEALADHEDAGGQLVEDVMSVEPRYLTVGDSTATALEIMRRARIRHLPVVDEGELVGIVSLRDLIDSARSTR